jgi:hypothetical protein
MSNNNVSSDLTNQIMILHQNTSNLDLNDENKSTTATFPTNSFNYGVESMISNDLFSSLSQISNYQPNDFEQNGPIMINNSYTITNNHGLIRVNSLNSPTPSPSTSSTSSSSSNENSYFAQNLTKPINYYNNENNLGLFYSGIDFKCKYDLFCILI